ncbi:NB-ARC domain-containing protein [Lentzea sp. NPDC059081]|uniref:WD40 domain-containing protein n=1 Tax=Lentzea sp. NPDC059081 TaxID=3346719 RepID=UPI0036C31EAB
MEVRLLGKVGVHGHGVEHPLPSTGPRCVLAALALNAGKPVPADRLVDYIWLPSKQTDKSPGTLAKYANLVGNAIRKAGGEPESLRYDSRDRRYTLHIAPADVDYHRFGALRAEARRRQNPDLFDQAAALWTGEPLADVQGQWAANRRHDLTTELREFQHERFQVLITAGQADRVFRELALLVEDAPEDAFLTDGALALAELGRRAEIPQWIDRFTRLCNQIKEASPLPKAMAEARRLSSPVRGLDGGADEFGRALVPDSLAEAKATPLRGGPDLAEKVRPGGMALPSPPPNFVPRPVEGSLLISALIDADSATTVGLRSATAVHGTGGYGKTSLAAWACHSPEVQAAFPDGIHWVELGRDPSMETIVGALSDLAAMLSGERPRGYSTVFAAGAAFAEATRDRRALIVVDDVWNARDLDPFLRGEPTCKLLVTTRQPRSLPPDAVRIEVDRMTPTQAQALLGAGLDPATQPTIFRLYERSGRWPIVLSLLNGVLLSMANKFALPVADIVDDILARLDRLGVAGLDAIADERERTIAGTLELSLDELAATAGADTVRRMMTLCCFPAGTLIDFSLLEILWDADRLEVRRTCAALADRSLVQGITRDGVHLHDVIHDYLRRSRWPDVLAGHTDLVGAARTMVTDGWHELPRRLPALVNLLAYQLVNANLEDELRSTLSDLRYHAARMVGSGPAGLANDTFICSTAFTRDPFLAALARCLSLEGHVVVGLDRVEDVASTWYSRLVGHRELRSEIRLAADLLADALVAEHPFPDLPDERLRQVLHGHAGPVSALAWRADGNQLATASEDGTVRVWDPRSGRELLSVRLPADRKPGRLAWSTDGLHIAAGGDGFVALIDPVLGDVLALEPLSGPVGSVRFAPGSDYLLVTTGDGLETRTLEGLRQSAQLYLRAKSAIFLADGRALAAGIDGPGQLSTLDVAADSLAVLQQAETPAQVIRGLARHPSGDSVLVLATGPALLLVDPDSLELIARSADQDLARSAAAWNDSGIQLAVSTGDGHVDIWGRPEDGALHFATTDPLRRSWEDRLGFVTTLDYHGRQIRDVAWQPGGDQLAVAAHSPVVRLWSGLSDDRATSTDTGLYCVAWHPSGSLVATGGLDGELRIVQASDGRSWPRKRHDGQIRGLAWSPDGTLLATYGEDGRLLIWSIGPEPTPLAAITPNQGPDAAMNDWAGPLVWSTAGIVVATGGLISLVQLTDRTPRLAGEVNVGHFISAMACAPGGTHAFVGTADTALTIVDLATMQVAHHDAGDEPIAAIRMVDGRPVTCDRIGRIHIWDRETWRPHPHALLPTDTFYDCDVSADGNAVVAIGSDSHAYLRSGAPDRLASCLRVDAALNACAISPGGDQVALAGSAGLYRCRIGWTPWTTAGSPRSAVR